MLALVSQECWPPNLANAFIVCPPSSGHRALLLLRSLFTRTFNTCACVCVCFVFSSASAGKLIETHSLSFTFPYSAAYAQCPRCRILNLPQACHVYTLCPAISERALSTSHSHTEVDRVHTHTNTHTQLQCRKSRRKTAKWKTNCQLAKECVEYPTIV